MAAVPTFEGTLLALLALGVLHSIIGGKRPLAVRLRGPVVAVTLLGLGAFFARVQGPEVMERFAAVGLVAGLAAGVGVLPYLHPIDPDEPLVSSPVVWLVVAAALAGSAPFAGFAARLLLLRAATQLFWPLAIVLAAGMLLWLPGSLRLGRSLGLPKGRQAVGVALVLAVNVAAGLYPLPILLAAHL